MSYTALDSIQWGGTPRIGVRFGYDSRRSGSAMQYRIYVTVEPLTGASYFGYPIYLSVYVDGSCVSSGYTLKAASPNRWSSSIEYDSGWVTAAGASGSAPLTIRLYSGSGATRDDSDGYALPVERAESIGDFSLTAGDAVVGQTGTLTITRPGYGYSFVCTYALGTASGSIGDLRTVSSSSGRVVYQWTVPESLAHQITASTWASGTVTVKVYSGGTLVGTLRAPFTAYVPESMRPVATLQVSVVNDDAAVRDWGLCIQGVSRLEYTVTASGQGGASIRTCRFCFGGQELAGSSGTTGLIGVSGILVPTVTVTDSRGRSVTVQGEAVTVWEYHPPVITASAVVRCGIDGTPQDDGAYLKVKCTATCSQIQTRNSVQIRARFRPMGGAWSGYTELLGGLEQLLGGGLSPTASYEVELSAVDAVGGVRTVRYTASTSQVTMHLRSGGKGAAFGKYSEGERLECAWPAVFYGDVAVSGALTVNGETVEALAYPVGSVRLTDSAAPPETADGLTWESVETGIAGVYGWRRTS